jgi:DNA-binding protein HU-beta
LDFTSQAIVSSLKKGETVSIQGFGSLESREKQEREIVNPTTKQVIKVPAKISVVFKVGITLKEKIKNLTHRGE